METTTRTERGRFRVLKCRRRDGTWTGRNRRRSFRGVRARCD